MTKKSIVLVTVDCLRADHTGFMGYKIPTTPFLDSLAAESFIVPAAIVAGAPTYYSLPAILASRYPLALGRDVVGLAPDEPNLASTFQEAGYATAFFGAGNPYISQRFGYGFGFDTFRDFLNSQSFANSDSQAKPFSANSWLRKLNWRVQESRPRLGYWGAAYDELYFQYCQRRPPPRSLDALRRFPTADVIVDQARSWLASLGGAPFFLWLHLMDPHSPYYPVEKSMEQLGQPATSASRARYLNSFWNRSDLSPRRLGRHCHEIIGLYDAGIRWVDTQMARLIEALRRLRLWDDCIFAITADHGEEFLDHGGRYHPPTRLMEELIHVPLLLRVPGSQKKEVRRSPFSLLHLAPTLLDAADLQSPSSFRGKSQWKNVRASAAFDDVVVAESIAGCTNPFHPDRRFGARALAVRERRFKLTFDFATSSERLYDLEADPDERTPLPPSAEKAVRRRLLDYGREHLRRSITERDLDARARSQLRDISWGEHMSSDTLQWPFPEARAS